MNQPTRASNLDGWRRQRRRDANIELAARFLAAGVVVATVCFLANLFK